MTTETPTGAAQGQKLKITVTEETTATYLVSPEWLEENGFPQDLATLNDYISSGIDFAGAGEDPVDELALKLEGDDEHTLSEYSVTERDLSVESGE